MHKGILIIHCISVGVFVTVNDWQYVLALYVFAWGLVLAWQFKAAMLLPECMLTLFWIPQKGMPAKDNI